MARKPKAAAVAAPKAETDGIAPLLAIHKITYGARQHAAPKSIFVPVSEKERDELLRMGAARELDDAELLIAQAGGVATEPTDEDETDAAADAATDAAAAGAHDPATDPDVIA